MAASRKKADEHLEQDLDLCYTIKIKTLGKLSKHPDEIGMILANLCGLNFTDSEVKRGKKSYKRKTNAD